MAINPALLEDAKRKASLGCATSHALLEEIRTLQTTLDSRSVSMGVGSGDGNLFVYGDYESIKAAQALILNT